MAQRKLVLDAQPQRKCTLLLNKPPYEEFEPIKTTSELYFTQFGDISMS
jgi:hypothetical protein